MIKYLATDLDGTLLEPKSLETYVCNQNKNTINLFNGNVFLVSGRNQQFIQNVCKELKINETFVACNGAVIYINGKRVFTSHIENKTIISIIDHVKTNHTNYQFIFIDENGKLYSLYDNEKLVLERENFNLQAHPKLAYVTDKNIEHISNLLNGENKIIKLNLNIDKDQKMILLQHLESKYNDLAISVCNNSLEITAKDINKGLSLKRLINKLSINEDSVYVIGDDGNDLSMFNIYKNSFIVKNNNNAHLFNKVKHVLNTFDELKNYMED